MSESFAPSSSELFNLLWDRQSGVCALCHKQMPRSRFELAHATLWKKYRPTFDHIIPRAAGGPDTPENLQLAHARCNKVKGRSQAGSVGRVKT